MQSRFGYNNAKKGKNGQKRGLIAPFYGFYQTASGDLAGNRTRDCAVRGRRLNRLTTRPFRGFLRDYSISRTILQPILCAFPQKFSQKKTSANAAFRKWLTRFSQVGAPRKRNQTFRTRVQTSPIPPDGRSRIKSVDYRVSRTPHTAGVGFIISNPAA